MRPVVAAVLPSLFWCPPCPTILISDTRRGNVFETLQPLADVRLAGQRPEKGTTLPLPHIFLDQPAARPCGQPRDCSVPTKYRRQLPAASESIVVTGIRLVESLYRSRLQTEASTDRDQNPAPGLAATAFCNSCGSRLRIIVRRTHHHRRHLELGRRVIEPSRGRLPVRQNRMLARDQVEDLFIRMPIAPASDTSAPAQKQAMHSFSSASCSSLPPVLSQPFLGRAHGAPRIRPCVESAGSYSAATGIVHFS